ncbi:DUF4906 domain-containing protein [Parabacteroides faecis]|uniref:DUF4906 domain-containing protein n=1 Tax=Parabacteroides TaxID=375288 RepID=UPI000EFDEE0F|nr:MULTISPECIES: DUF4906 domain-containing protein [Parabacteroides]MBC8618102.1 DUF4906 domain-containing protein [Parabacteroides faecis]RHR99154.1 DUF4906 domain-containing protein [Parabacteroides sp. AF14-59]
MKKTYLMLLLALAGLGSSCTNEDGTEGVTPSGDPGEIQLVFSGSGEEEEYTKAIASDSENKISKLDVYLFGAASASTNDADYHYIETWKMTEATPTGNQFILQPSGSSWTASIKPNELKGLPYLTLVCVANQDKLFNADGTDFATLGAVTTDAVTGDITAAGTTLDAFKAAYTAKMADPATDFIKTPLAMTGTGTTKISGSVSKVAITLKRIVARFDIDNTTSTSQLTIEQVSMGKGRSNGSLFGATLTDAAAGDLVTYKDVDFTGENANQGTLESAIYVYPNIPGDESFLIIKGKYKSPSTGEQIAVTYNIPVVKTPADAQPDDPANYIAINANSRYKLRITDVTESNIYSTFEVEDWTSGGGIIIKPDNTKPEFNKFAGTNPPTDLTGGYYRTLADGTFDIVMTSTGELEYSRSLVTKAGDEIDWLTVGTPTTEQKDGLTITTFPVTIADATGKRPVSLTFINQAASYDPDLQTTLTFVGPEAAPVVSEVVEGHSEGNSVDVTSPDAPEATMVKAVGSYISLNVFCVDGIADITSPTGYSVTEVATEGFTTTYRVAITDAGTAADNATIEFKNKAADSNMVTLTIKHKKASQPSIVANDNGSYTNSSYNDGTLGGTVGAVTADMYLIDGSTIYVKATCTESVAAGAVTVAAPAGVTVTEETAVPGIFKIEIPTAASLIAGTAVTVTFKNATDETVTSTLEITPKSAKPTVSLTDNASGAVTELDGTCTVDLGSLSTNTFTLTVTAPKGATVDLTTPLTGKWLELDSGDTGKTTITAGASETYMLKAAGDTSSNDDVVLTFTNTVSGGGDLTVTLKKKI